MRPENPARPFVSFAHEHDPLSAHACAAAVHDDANDAMQVMMGTSGRNREEPMLRQSESCTIN